MVRLKEGDIIDLKIEGISKKGDGVARVNGFIVFVKGAQTGENTKVKIVKVMKTFAIGVAMK